MDFLVLPSYPPILKRYEEAQEAEYFRHQKQKHCGVAGLSPAGPTSFHGKELFFYKGSSFFISPLRSKDLNFQKRETRTPQQSQKQKLRSRNLKQDSMSFLNAKKIFTFEP